VSEPFDNIDLDVVAKLENGCEWVELHTIEQGMLAQKLSRTAIGTFMRSEIEANPNGKLPHRWFMLLDRGIPQAHVAMCLPGDPEGVAPYKTPVHIVGFQNANAYPQWEEAINALGVAIGMSIPRNYFGRDLPADG